MNFQVCLTVTGRILCALVVSPGRNQTTNRIKSSRVSNYSCRKGKVSAIKILACVALSRMTVQTIGVV